MDSKRKKVQTRKTFEAFKEEPKTMKQVSVETGIMRPNICRYTATWKEEKKIALVKEDLCPITKHKAGFYTTDPEKVDKIYNQQSLAGV